MDELLHRYASEHRHPINRILHFVGIPFLGISSLGLIGQLRVPVSEDLELNLGLLPLLAASCWYAIKSWRALPLGIAFVGGSLAIGMWIPLVWLIGLAAVGMLAHFVGHFCFEKVPPSTFREPRSILVAPFWLLHQVVRSTPPNDEWHSANQGLPSQRHKESPTISVPFRR